MKAGTATTGLDACLSAGPRLTAVYQELRARLLAQRGSDGAWTGELASSALSTATAICALHALDRRRYTNLTDAGVRWLVEHQNADGGWGDTVKSRSNLSTTMLVRAALTVAGSMPLAEGALRRAEAYLERTCGGTEPRTLAEAIRARYGKDRTFSVPILTCCALAGLVGWNEVTPLPFELACASPALYSRLRLPVVSYALPALIALGIARFKRGAPGNPLVRFVRRLALRGALRRLESIQPSSGGFLEATPLTSFVTMSLADAGFGRHPAVARAAEFLVRSVRPDGSWPIDTNLATWVTTLSVNALAVPGVEGNEDFDTTAVRDWLIRQQYRAVHPYTNAAPGGWAWTPLPGGVPDADDTAGALLALRNLPPSEESCEAAVAGLRWLLNLQNRDGGWPTFCRGWGHLPFDRSGADLSAHVLRALRGWADTNGVLTPLADSGLRDKARRAIERGFAFLERAQRPDGAWVPLWFGNQHAPDEENPTYGTARVLRAYVDLGRLEKEPAQRGIGWLLGCQGDDGGWGGAPGTPPTIEETALAVETLSVAGERAAGVARAVERGVEWLIERAERAALGDASPIGFYFAKLWYSEKLYPLIFTVGALGRVLRGRAGDDDGGV